MLGSGCYKTKNDGVFTVLIYFQGYIFSFMLHSFQNVFSPPYQPQKVPCSIYTPSTHTIKSRLHWLGFSSPTGANPPPQPITPERTLTPLPTNNEVEEQ